MWLLERLGLAERFLRAGNARRPRPPTKGTVFRGFAPGPQDVMVMTYPKSGTNWVLQIAYQLVHHGHGEFDHIHSVVPWPGAAFGPRVHVHEAIPLELATDWQRAPEKKRIIKTHSNWEAIPYSDAAHYIAVIRDPKEVFVSHYLFSRAGLLGATMPSLDILFRMYVDRGLPPWGCWAEKAAGYWAQRHRPNVLVMSFKAMKRDLRAAVVRVAEFLDIDVDGSVIDKVVELSSFAHMKSICHKFSVTPLFSWQRSVELVRKGTRGDSGELLSREQQLEIDRHFIAKLERLGCDLPYDEFCDPAR